MPHSYSLYVEPLNSRPNIKTKNNAGRRRFKRTCQDYGIYEGSKYSIGTDAPLLVLLRFLFRTWLDIGSNQQNIREFSANGRAVFAYLIYQSLCFGFVGFELFGNKGRKE